MDAREKRNNTQGNSGQNRPLRESVEINTGEHRHYSNHEKAVTQPTPSSSNTTKK